MKFFVNGIVLTAAMGLVGCGKDNAKTESRVDKKEKEVDNTLGEAQAKEKAELAKTLQTLKENVDAIKNAIKKDPSFDTSELVKTLEAKVQDLMTPLKESSAADKGSLDTIKEQLSDLRAAIANTQHGEIKIENNEQIQVLLSRLDAFEKNLDMSQTPFHKACMVSLNVPDADDVVKRKVLNAMAFINTSKLARASEITQRDFDNATSLLRSTKYLPGVVFSGTHSEFRKVDESHTYYAYSRLPSIKNYETLEYYGFTTEANNINGTHANRIVSFLANDQNNNYTSADIFSILNEQNPLKAIDANKIESYTRLDCDRTATYMANVGSKALTTAVDNTNYLASLGDSTNTLSSYIHDLRTRIGENKSFVSDIFAWLDYRLQDSWLSSNAHKGHSDSPRVMVIQDDLLRASVDGSIDYSFLDLVDAPHLRFLAAMDSEIGKAKMENDVDFDNAYKGKNESLISFVTRHRKDVDHSRREKSYTDLEAVFIDFIPEIAKVHEPEIKKKAKNLFHTPAKS